MIASDIEKLAFWSRIRDMWKLIRKWWFLQRLEYQINYHTGKYRLENILSGESILSSESFFIDGTSKYPGIAKRPLGKYLSWLLFWRLFEGEKRYKRRVHEYMKFFKQWKEKKYIDTIAIPKDGDIVLMPNLSSKGEDAHGLAGLFELLLERYPLTWSATGKIIAFVIMSAGGIYGFIKLIGRLLK